MEGKNVNNLHQPYYYDESLFTDRLKDLRNVKEQLYEAADHFEDLYYKNDQKQVLLESLKDYISKSLIKTVDHLGAITYKLNNLLDQNLNQVSQTKLQIVCLEQRLRTCQVYADNVGLSQHLVTTQTPKYPKKYTVPEDWVSEEKDESRKGYSGQFSPGLVDFSFAKAALNKRIVTREPERRARSVSPLRLAVKRSSSASASSVNRSITPNSYLSRNKLQQPTEGWRSCSLYSQRGRTKAVEVDSKKTRNLFKVLLNMYKSRNNT